MNNFPNILNVAKSVKHRSTFPLDFQHLTTMDFGKTSILHAMEVVPNDVIDIDLSCVTQLAPLVVPTMGEVNLYVRAFFVPYRFVWKDWEEFFSQFATRKGTTQAINNVPILTPGAIWEMFKDSVGTDTDLMEEVGSDDAYDFISAPTSSSLSVRYKLTPLGRLFNQILTGLGYIVFPIYSNSSQFIEAHKFSALPLLSLVKVFRDYYVNPNYDYTTIDNLLCNEPWTNEVDSEQLRTMLEFIAFGWFENDIFTSAWANPEQVGYSSVYKQQDIRPDFGLFPTDEIITSANATNESLTALENPNAFSQRGLNVLKQIYNFSLRQAAAGARYVDQLLSRFGIRMNENEARRSHFIGSAVFDTSISRVDATSTGEATFPDGGTLRSALGDFTGRGIMTGNGHFHYENKNNDFGMLLFVAHIIPRTNYYQGIKPHCNHISFNDFFNPDLEDIGNAPIRQNELFFDYKTASDVENHGAELNSVFGFAPNYYDYKSQTSYLTGDFRLPSLNSALKSFQLFRTLRGPGQAENYDSSSEAVLNEQFQKFTPQNCGDWLRMFLTQTEDADHFICSFMFKVRATRDMNSLGNSLLAELNEHGNDVGDIIKVRPNGKYF